jgi:hypothetical protein
MTFVRMIHSAGEYVAGEEYDMPDEQGDRFIVLGYATGSLSRDYSSEEIADLHEGHQEVSA